MKSLIVVLAFVMTGCAAKKPVTSLVYVDIPCLNGPVVLEKCDWSSPPHCKKVTVLYKRGCERVAVK
jgi:hypothetical protein